MALENGKNKKILNCGVCGACSNENDVSRMREIGTQVARVVGPCLISYFIFGKWVDYFCMEARAKYTPECSSCWVQDHGCLGAHCFYDCVFGSLQNWERLFYPNKTGQISTKEGCIDCMEKKCSYSYIHSCGANRRTAGIATDIQRDASEICKDATT